MWAPAQRQKVSTSSAQEIEKENIAKYTSRRYKEIIYFIIYFCTVVPLNCCVLFPVGPSQAETSTPNNACSRCKNNERPTGTNTTNWMGRRWNLEIKAIQNMILTEIVPPVHETWCLKTHLYPVLSGDVFGIPTLLVLMFTWVGRYPIAQPLSNLHPPPRPVSSRPTVGVAPRIEGTRKAWGLGREAVTTSIVFLYLFWWGGHCCPMHCELSRSIVLPEFRYYLDVNMPIKFCQRPEKTGLLSKI